MKHFKFSSLLIVLAAVLAISTRGLQAGEEHRPSAERILDFLREKMPESMELVQRVRDEEGEEGYQEVLEAAGDLLMEYLEIKEEDGVPAAGKFLAEERDRVRMEMLVEAWHESDDEAGRGEIREEIKGLIGAQIDREIDHGDRELGKLKEEVAEIEEELAGMKENRAQIIAEELAEILSEEEGEEEEGERQKLSITQSWSQEENYKRPYWINIPEREDDDPLPVIIFLHGNGGNPGGLQEMVFGRYPELVRQFVTVFPEGYRESWNIVSERSKADDRGFIEAIIRELVKRDDVRKKDFTIMGISNGAALVNQIAIETKLANIKNYISSVSPLNGFQHDGENFKAMGKENDYRMIAKPLAGKRLLNISGTDDPLVPYLGGPSRAIPAKGGKLPFVNAEESIFLWARQMGFEGEKLAGPGRVNGKIEVFSYLDGDVVHFKVNDHGHNATRALTERLLLDFVRDR